MKANVARASKPGEDEATAKNSAAKVTNAEAQGKNLKAYNPEEINNTISSQPEDLVNSKSINLIQAVLKPKKSPRNS